MNPSKRFPGYRSTHRHLLVPELGHLGLEHVAVDELAKLGRGQYSIHDHAALVSAAFGVVGRLPVGRTMSAEKATPERSPCDQRRAPSRSNWTGDIGASSGALSARSSRR